MKDSQKSTVLKSKASTGTVRYRIEIFTAMFVRKILTNTRL
jgi:hypothetical protein